MIQAYIQLSEELSDFVQQEMNSRGLTDVTEYFQSLLLKEKERREQETLEALVMEGINSGPSIPLTEEVWDDLIQKAHKRFEK